MKKFWIIKNSAESTSAELLIYGPLVSESRWLDSDCVSASEFRSDLQGLAGKDVVVRVNSPGGDVFAGQTIHNLLRSYKGHVTAIVDGVAASAASVVVMGAEKIIMPANSMMMIHNPALCLKNAAYNAQDLQKCLDALAPIKESLLSAYMRRAKVDRAEMSRMMDDETWLTADECLRLGLADEIDGSIETALDGNTLVVNAMKFDTKNFTNLAGLQKCLAHDKKKVEDRMSLNISAIKNFLNDLGVDVKDDAQQVQPVQPAAPAVDAQKVAAETVAAERKRVEDLDRLADESKNASVSAIVAMAKKTGKTVDEIKEYVDAVQSVSAPAAANLSNLIADAQDSGTDGIQSDPLDQKHLSEKDEIKNMADALANCMG